LTEKKYRSRNQTPKEALAVHRPNLTDAPHSVTRERRNSPRHIRFAALCAAAITIFAGCTVGPNYVRPTAEVPTDFKETPANWKQAQPSDAVAKGKWWEIYQDPQLNELEEQINVSNQTLKAEQEQFAQARAALRITRSNLFPNVSTSPSVTRTHLAPNEPNFNSTLESTDYNTFTIPVDVSYEVDLWGRVRRTVEASRSEAQATGADLANVSLSLHAELAGDYFQLRGLDAQKQLLDSTVVSFQKALDLTQSRFHGGLASAVDVAQAKTILDTTRAESTDVGVQRAAFEHAIAVLIGKPASQFSLPLIPLTAPPPVIPSGLPSDLLERRPDISAAERRVQEQNAQIGVARAAYFPQLTLSGSGGFESTAFTTLLQGPSGFWLLGGQAAEYLFDGGARRGASDQAKAAWNQSVDNYRQTVLVAFQEVEDNLAALRILEVEANQEAEAVASAEHSLSLSVTRYRGGVANYLEVTTAQSAALADEVTAVNLLTRRLAASVLLIKAIGGGWNVSQLPHV
jgi:NodT family efflux transporter outer membrane factor (OMF) lipoprotein